VGARETRRRCRCRSSRETLWREGRRRRRQANGLEGRREEPDRGVQGEGREGLDEEGRWDLRQVPRISARARRCARGVWRIGAPLQAKGSV